MKNTFNKKLLFNTNKIFNLTNQNGLIRYLSKYSYRHLQSNILTTNIRNKQKFYICDKFSIHNQFYSKLIMVDKDQKLTNVQDVEGFLKSENINYHIQSHEAVMTSADHSKVKCNKEIEYTFIKNMVCKTKSDYFIYYMLPGEKKADFKALEKFMKEKNGTIRNSDDNVLTDFLKVNKGAVNPFSLLNLTSENKNTKFRLVVDSSIQTENVVVHPMDNAFSVWVNFKDLIKVLEKHGLKPLYFNPEDFAKTEVVVNKKEEKDSNLVNQADEEKHKLAIQNKKEMGSFSDWYEEVIKKSEMVSYYSDISGCYILRPYSFEIWENITKFFDAKIKAIGVKNCYFPMFVSEDALNKEKSHVEGFSAEVAWVTHHGDKPLDKKVALRPTSETVMYPYFAKWINSHRDFPLLLNQWCNVVRWEFKHPTPFIRTREFLWQEGHSAHTSESESDEFMLKILGFYEDVFSQLLAIPVIKGFKSENEKFAGALRTSTIETLVTENGKGIQCATSHNLGQNFSKMFDIKYLDKNKEFQYAWQESWGLSTRSIGVMIMIHSDNNGLVLPPRVAPIQVVTVPIITSSDKNGEISKKLEEISNELTNAGIRVKFDNDEMHNPGFKYNYWELKGVPLRIEFGKKDLEQKQVTMVARDNKTKVPIPIEGLVSRIKIELDNFHDRLYNSAKERYDAQRKEARSFQEFHSLLNKRNSILTPWCTDPKCEDEVKLKVKSLSEQDEENAGTCKTLCLPLQQEKLKDDDVCFNCGQKAFKWAMWGRSY